MIAIRLYLAVLIMQLPLALSASSIQKPDENTRYILIEAPCKSSFAYGKSDQEKAILTKILKMEFESPFEMVNAEPDLISKFEVALEEQFPGSLNHIEDILVYMITTEKEAKELHNRKTKQFKTRQIEVVELKIK